MVKIGIAEKRELRLAKDAGALVATTYDERRVLNQLAQKKLMRKAKKLYGLQAYKLTPKGNAYLKAWKMTH